MTRWSFGDILAVSGIMLVGLAVMTLALSLLQPHVAKMAIAGAALIMAGIAIEASRGTP